MLWGWTSKKSSAPYMVQNLAVWLILLFSLVAGVFCGSAIWFAAYIFLPDFSWPLAIGAFCIGASGLLTYWAVYRVETDIARYRAQTYAHTISIWALQRWQAREQALLDRDLIDVSDAAVDFSTREIKVGGQSRPLTVVEAINPNVRQWYLTMADGLRWSARYGSMASRDLVGRGKPFGSVESWAAWKNVLVASGMAASVPGAGTEWADGWGYRKAIDFFDRRLPIVFPNQKAPSVAPWTGSLLSSPSLDSPSQSATTERPPTPSIGGPLSARTDEQITDEQ